jgi:hypothetical protein
MKSSVFTQGCVKSIETFLVYWIPLETALVSGYEVKAQTAV